MTLQLQYWYLYYATVILFFPTPRSLSPSFCPQENSPIVVQHQQDACWRAAFFFATRSTQVFSLSQCHHHSVVVLQAPSQATRSLFPVPLFFVFRPAFPSQSRSVASPSVIMVNVARLTAYYSPKTPMI